MQKTVELAIPRDLRGAQALIEVLRMGDVRRVLDVGTGQGIHADLMEAVGKHVTRLDLGRSQAYRPRPDVIVGDFLTLPLPGPFDCIWASHVLEHSLSPHDFLKRCVALAREDGVLAITVPPAKPELVGGHLSLWTPGLLLYHLVLAGVNCRTARVLRHGYNISVLVRNRAVVLPELGWDQGDIERLQPFLPEGFHHGINTERFGEVAQDAIGSFDPGPPRG